MLNQSLINFGMGSAALTLMLLGLACVLLMKDTDPWTRRFFRLLATVSTLYVFCNLAGQIAEAVGAPVKWWIFFESLFSSVLMPMLTVYLMHCAGRRLYNPWTYAVMGLWLVYFLLLTSTLYSPAIYYFTPEGDYHRGAFYPWLLAPAVGIMLLNLAALVSLRGSLARREFTAMLRKIHDTLVPAGKLPDMRETAIKWAEFMRGHLPEDKAEMFSLLDRLIEMARAGQLDHFRENVAGL